MILKGKNLRLYYYDHKNCYLKTLNEIRKEKYGYNLTPGQTIKAIRYENTNRECHFNCEILSVTKEGITFLKENYRIKGRTMIEVFTPWRKKFFIPCEDKEMECDLFIEPCEILHDENKLKDVLNNNIVIEDRDGKGMWNKHGGWRMKSENSEKNLKNFIELGQLAFY